ncbi:sigma-54-dependent transcriptional regulator [Pyrinomonas methylaliphatogenes]|uniref:Two component, sigma54 specific, transcriptional regulator, Fis family n=1 Tax=Pyrinomonas methylaliphatogenes TaxID=454194 RepID=A0A0B6WWJ9_9BACT|nr:sigma-54 dependent transcriptional regulator [Pyrinomonas methylaliphatogenes]MBX5478200.1 sigma-54-dependent Fis family transcriptional regulator [Pyrinomonas methylaliphatogenes]CDM65663.1 two component, sigma54 specific, transcriptional regulator, Fis family [Pyrinomonas methylaliphatogenes]
MPNVVLIVDDEQSIRDALRAVLEDEGYVAEAVASGEECLRAIEQRAYDCILLDVWLPGIDGLETLRRLRESGVDAAIVMISGHGTIETAVRATKLGAFDFIEKPLSVEKTVLTVRNALRQLELERMNAAFKAKLRSEYELIGESVAMRAVRQQIALVAPTDGRVLIYGESGTGKELVARAIHAASRRAAAPFVELNCAAIPDELIESELFGHIKGAFTGATAAKKGKFELADGATLFLDEVGDMSARVQAKVLRVLEEQRFEPVGSTSTVKVDVRIIAATNKRLEAEIERGTFRADLFYRLNVIPFEIPPLRERLEDVPLLVEHFNRRFSAAYGKEPKEFTPEAMERLQQHSWPGNVRELRNTVERVVIMHTPVRVRAKDLPPLGGDAAPVTQTKFPSFKEASEAYQREYIKRKLAEAEGNVSRAAELMGIDRSHLYRRMRALGINVREERSGTSS